MTYRAPVADIAFTLKHGAGLARTLAQGGDLTADDVDAVLEEAGRFATDVIAPLNAVGDKSRHAVQGRRRHHAARLEGGLSRLGRPPAGTRSRCPRAWGGQALPHALNAACIEMWNSASMAFGIGPVLTMGAVEALAALRHRRAQAAPICQSSCPANGWARCSSPSRRPAPTSARCAPRPSAPATAAIASPGRRSSSPTASTISPTTSSISCWRGCPMRRPATGASRCSWCRSSWSTRTARSARATTCARIRSSTSSASTPRRPAPWSTAINGGAIGYLVGEENRGLACMFTMMNLARLAVGLQGVGIAERATQQALHMRASASRAARSAPAAGSSAIIEHPDVKRMLMTMRALTRAARAICYATAGAIDAQPRQRRRRESGGRRARRCSRRSPRRSRPTSASRSPRSACRCTAAWASSRRPARRSICATRGSPRSTKAPTASRRSIW